MILPKANNRNTLILAIAAVLFWLLVSALDVRAQADCEVRPDGSTLCCQIQPDVGELCTSSISSTLTPFVPTGTPVAPVAPTVQPTAMPTIEILPWKRFVYLPIGAKP